MVLPLGTAAYGAALEKAAGADPERRFSRARSLAAGVAYPILFGVLLSATLGGGGAPHQGAILAGILGGTFLLPVALAYAAAWLYAPMRRSSCEGGAPPA